MGEPLKFRTLHADEIELRVGTVSAKGASLLLYKDARCDQAVIDETVGAMNWQRHHSRDNANCTVDIWDADKGVWVSKEDTGTESMTEKEKGLASDSFKRACTNWGIGRELYSSPFIFVPVDTQKKQSGKGYELVNPYVFSGARVSDIEYDDKRKIKALTIVDKDGVVMYQYPKKRMSKDLRNSLAETKTKNEPTAPKQSKSKQPPTEPPALKLGEPAPPKDRLTAEQAEGIKGLLEDLGIDTAVFLNYVAEKSKKPCSDVDSMTTGQYDIAVQAINVKLAKIAKENQ